MVPLFCFLDKTKTRTIINRTDIEPQQNIGPGQTLNWKKPRLDKAKTEQTLQKTNQQQNNRWTRINHKKNNLRTRINHKKNNLRTRTKLLTDHPLDQDKTINRTTSGPGQKDKNNNLWTRTNP